MNADEWLDSVIDLDPPGWSSRRRQRDEPEENFEITMEHETLHYERGYYRGKARR
jgi:hypothetical protein